MGVRRVDLDQRAAGEIVGDQRGPGAQRRADRQHLVAPVAVEIGDARRQVLEDLVGGKRHGDAVAVDVLHDQRTGLDLVAEGAVRVAVGRLAVPGGGDALAVGIGDGAAGDAVGRRHRLRRVAGREAERLVVAQRHLEPGAAGLGEDRLGNLPDRRSPGRPSRPAPPPSRRAPERPPDRQHSARAAQRTGREAGAVMGRS